LRGSRCAQRQEVLHCHRADFTSNDKRMVTSTCVQPDTVIHTSCVRMCGFFLNINVLPVVKLEWATQTYFLDDCNKTRWRRRWRVHAQWRLRGGWGLVSRRCLVSSVASTYPETAKDVMDTGFPRGQRHLIPRLSRLERGLVGSSNSKCSFESSTWCRHVPGVERSASPHVTDTL